MKTLIVIPARYGSTRLPGKPLALIAGATLLSRVIDIAQAVRRNTENVDILVATDDERIGAHAAECGVAWTMTDASCPTGTDRVYQAVKSQPHAPDFVINLQGDAPFTPPDFLEKMIGSFAAEPCDVLTTAVQLSWLELDTLRENKKKTPLSGTTVCFDQGSGLAYWFSKNIIPAIRKEENLRQTTLLSPVWRHIGLYGYSTKMLDAFVSLPEGTMEALEGLEQLRVLEHGYDIRCIPVSYEDRPGMSGIDSPEDIARAEDLIRRFGEPLATR